MARMTAARPMPAASTIRAQSRVSVIVREGRRWLMSRAWREAPSGNRFVEDERAASKGSLTSGALAQIMEGRSKHRVNRLGVDVAGFPRARCRSVTTKPLPISERELWACAQKIINRHGRDAEWHAAVRADELLSDGDLDGQRVWKAILARIVDWRRESLPPLLQ